LLLLFLSLWWRDQAHYSISLAALASIKDFLKIEKTRVYLYRHPGGSKTNWSRKEDISPSIGWLAQSNSVGVSLVVVTDGWLHPSRKRAYTTSPAAAAFWRNRFLDERERDVTHTTKSWR
jgi:hypothetical protein